MHREPLVQGGLSNKQSIFADDLHDRIFQGNTNSHFALLEFQNPTDEREFEADLIASTNEINYSHQNFLHKQHLQTDENVQEDNRVLMEHFDNELIRTGIPSHLEGDHLETLSEPDLHLDLSDFLDDDFPPSNLLDEFEYNEKRMEERSSCCHDGCQSDNNYANESTFISYLPEPEQSLDMIPIDQTFENMDCEMNDTQLNSTKILPHAYPRSRFQSEHLCETFGTHSVSNLAEQPTSQNKNVLRDLCLAADDEVQINTCSTNKFQPLPPMLDLPGSTFEKIGVNSSFYHEDDFGLASRKNCFPLGEDIFSPQLQAGPMMPALWGEEKPQTGLKDFRLPSAFKFQQPSSSRVPMDQPRNPDGSPKPVQAEFNSGIDSNATTCSASSPMPKEGLKGLGSKRVVKKQDKRIPALNNPNKISKPPRKIILKKRSLEKKAAVKNQVQSQVQKKTKASTKTAPTTDSLQQQEQRESSRKVKQPKNNAQLNSEAQQCQAQKYYMNFDFYFKRTSFRTMTLFFKTAFKSYFEKWKTDKKKQPITHFLAQFANDHFPGLLSSLQSDLQEEFIELLKLLVFSHRHNKNDKHLQNPVVDFSIVREPMYKYSRSAQIRFFDYPTFAFLFAWFAQNPDAHSFSQAKFVENSDSHYPARMFQEVHLLGTEALKHLKESSSVIDSKMSSAKGAIVTKGILTAQTKLHLARSLDKYLLSQKQIWVQTTPVSKQASCSSSTAAALQSQ